MTEMIERRGVWVPVNVDERDERPAGLDQTLVVDGYTDRVRALEAAAAEADRVRALPTAAMLARRQALTEAAGLAELDAADHARRLRAEGERERADLAARADSAAAKRGLDANVHVRALGLESRRRRWSLIAWTVLVLAMAFTCVNVQTFASAGAPVGSPAWLVAWGVDPLLSLLVVGLLLARGDLAVLGLPIAVGKLKRAVYAVEGGVLGAVVLMNVAPTLTPGTAWQTVALHVVVPLAGMAAALVLPIIQARYAAAISSLYQPTADGASGRPENPINRDEHANKVTGEVIEEAELSAADRKVLADVRQAIAAGTLTHPPTAYGVYKHAMRGKGDKARASRVAAAVAATHSHPVSTS